MLACNSAYDPMKQQQSLLSFLQSLLVYICLIEIQTRFNVLYDHGHAQILE